MDFDETSVSSHKSDGGQQGGQPGDIDDLLFLDQNLTSASIAPTKECVIFLIDCAPSMHTLFEEEHTTPLTSILKVTENFLKTKIISSEKDPFGIVLFNAMIPVNEMNLDGVNNLIPVHPPNALTIKKIKEMFMKCDPELNKDTFQNELNSIFAPSEDPQKNYINNALWVCHSLLKNFDKKMYKRRVFLFTDNDDPIKNDTQEKNICLQRAKDMNESDIIIEIFPMNFKDKFNLANFYALIVPTTSDDDINSGGENIITIEQCADRLADISKRIRQKEMKKRNLTKCPFQITGNTKIYMNIYSNLKKSTKGRVFNIDAKTNKVLKSSTNLKCKETGDELYPEQIGTYLLYGNKKVLFNKDEMKKVKVLEQPGMTLMGFKSIESIRPYYNIRESYFIYPNEAYSNGAGRLVDALIKQMANKKKCAIVKFVAREGSLVRFCALMPQLERYDEDYFQTPPGFNMIVLPWADDLRANSDLLAKCKRTKPFISDKQSELARKIIKKMNISFDCRAFENYDLQKFYATLQALALGEPNVERVEDTIQPHEEGLTKVLNGVDEKYEHSIFEQDYGKDKKKRRKKEDWVGFVRWKYVKQNDNTSSDDSDDEKKKAEKKKEEEEKKVPKKRGRKNKEEKEKELKKKEKEKKEKEKDKEKEKGKKSDSSSSSSSSDSDSSSSSSSSYSSKKKKKKDKGSGSESDSFDPDDPKTYSSDRILKMIKHGEMDKFTVAKLRAIAKEKDIMTRGMSKRDIIEKLKSKLTIKWYGAIKDK